jgi:hypothetical protein
MAEYVMCHLHSADELELYEQDGCQKVLRRTLIIKPPHNHSLALGMLVTLPGLESAYEVTAYIQQHYSKESN